jgi:hypothetical protein
MPLSFLLPTPYMPKISLNIQLVYTVKFGIIICKGGEKNEKSRKKNTQND